MSTGDLKLSATPDLFVFADSGGFFGAFSLEFPFPCTRCGVPSPRPPFFFSSLSRRDWPALLMAPVRTDRASASLSHYVFPESGSFASLSYDMTRFEFLHCTIDSIRTLEGIERGWSALHGAGQ